MAKKQASAAAKKKQGRPSRKSGVPATLSIYLQDARIKPILERSAEQAKRKLSAWVVERCVQGGPPLPQKDIEMIRQIIRESGSGPVI